MFKDWLIKKLGGVPVSDIQAVVVSQEELAAANTEVAETPVPVVEPVVSEPVVAPTDFDKVKALVAKVEVGIEEAFDDALGIATELGGDVTGHLKDFLKEAGYALPAFDKIVAFAKKHL